MTRGIKDGPRVQPNQQNPQQYCYRYAPAFQVKQPHLCPESTFPVCDALILHIITKTKGAVLLSRSLLKETDNIRGLFLIHSLPT